MVNWNRPRWTSPTGDIGGPNFQPPNFRRSGAYACAPVSILDANGVLVTLVASGGSYTLLPANYYDLTFSFPAGAVLNSGWVVPFKGTLRLAALPTNCTSFLIRRVRGGTVTNTTTVPAIISLNEHDVLYIEVVPTSTASPVTFQVRIDYDFNTLTKTIPTIGGDSRYGYNINFRDQTVSCWDTSTGLVVATIVLPVGRSYRTGVYCELDQCGYVFGVSHYAKIDCNPASGTFNTVLTSGATGTGTYVASVYDGITDAFYIMSSGRLFKTVRATMVSTDVTSTYFIGADYLSGGPIPKMSFIKSMRCITLTDTNPGVAVLANIDDQFTIQRVISSGGGGLIKEFGGKLYWCEFDFMRVLRMSTPVMKPLNSVASTGARLGGVCFVPSLNRAYFSRHNFANIGVLNMATNFNLGTIGYSGSAVWGSPEIQYSPYSGYIYAREGSQANVNGITTIHIFNPASGAIGARIGGITVGNLESVSDIYANQMWFNGIAQ